MHVLGADRRGRVDGDTPLVWLHLFSFCQLTDWVGGWGGSMENFRLPLVAMLVNTVFIPKRQLSYTLNKLKQEIKIWQHLKQVNKKEKKKRTIQLRSGIKGNFTLKMPQVQEIASHRLAKG